MEIETIFKALSDPTRLTILNAVKDKERCICEIIPLTNKSQPNVSQHLKILKNAGLINQHKEGTRLLISIKDPQLKEIITKTQQLAKRL